MYNFFYPEKVTEKESMRKTYHIVEKGLSVRIYLRLTNDKLLSSLKAITACMPLMFANSNPDEQFTMYKITRWKNNQRQKNYCVYKISVYINISLQTTSLFIRLGAYNTSKLRFPIIFRSKWWWVRIMHQFVYILYTAKT